MAPLLVVGNWKMHTTPESARRLAEELRRLLAEDPALSAVEVAVCPPFVCLPGVREVLQGSRIRVGAQNLHPREEGAFTGEVSPRMLAGLCDFVILGHSERRRHFCETDAFINEKVRAALAHGLRPILCVGETLEERRAGRAEDVVEAQLRACLKGVEDGAGLAVAYEPVWAIGTGVPATPEEAGRMMREVVFGTLCALFGEHGAAEVPLLYGGSVTGENAPALAEQPFIHGALVGGASLRAEEFVRIVRAFAGT